MVMAIRTKENKKLRDIENEGKTWQTLSLALFLMLLAFFIVLNTLTTFDEARVTDVQSSIKTTFASNNPGDSLGITDELEQNTEMNIGKALDDLEALLKAQIGVVSISRAPDGETMYVNIPKTTLYNDHSRPNSSALSLGEQIARLLSGRETKSVKFIIEALANTEAQSVQAAEIQPNAMGLGVFIRNIIKGGLDGRLVRMGFQKGDTEFVSVVFHAHKTKHMALNLQGFNYTNFKFER